MRLIAIGCWVLSAAIAAALGTGRPALADPLVREQLVAAATSLADIKALAIPGDWSEVSVDVTSSLRADRRGEAHTFIVNNLFEWRAGADIETAINLFPDEAAATRNYYGRRVEDIQSYGMVVEGGPVGAESRLMRAEGDKAGSSQTLRWRHGRYVVRVTSIAPKTTLTSDMLARLAMRIDERLDLRDKGALAERPFPTLVRALPLPSDTMTTLATLSGTPDWWVWTDKDEPSPRLRALLAAGVGDGPVVERVFSLPAMPDHHARVTIATFRDVAAAHDYLAANTFAGKPNGQPDGNVWQVRPNGPWQSVASRGANVVEIHCAVVGEVTLPGCKEVVGRLLDQTLSRLQE